MKDAETHPLGEDVAIAIVVARANESVSRRLLRGAQDVLGERGIDEPDLYWVPSATDIPVIVLALAEKGGLDAIVALAGLVGDENNVVGKQAMQGLMQVQLDTGVPIGFGLLVAEDQDQALAQSGPKNNKGADAAAAALEMAELLRTIQG